MTAISLNTAWERAREPYFLLESIDSTNTTASITKVSAIKPPGWARYAQFFLNIDTITGSDPTLDFVVKGATESDLDTTALYTLGDWDGITQMTGASQTSTRVHVDLGPTITADDTGDATASCRYGVLTVLPPVLVYQLTPGLGTAGDNDYTLSLAVNFAR